VQDKLTSNRILRNDFSDPRVANSHIDSFFWLTMLCIEKLCSVDGRWMKRAGDALVER